jgi:acyl dehydratase
LAGCEKGFSQPAPAPSCHVPTSKEPPIARIVEFASYGAPEVLEFKDVPDPQPAAGEVRIRVRMTRSLGERLGEHRPQQNCDELQKAAMTKRYLEDFAAGQTFGSRRLRVGKEQIKAFAAEFDPQPFHLDEEVARDTIFRGLAASGCHTAALTMRLLVESEFNPAGGIVATGVDELHWPLPVRPGDELQVESEVLEVRPSQSRRNRGMIKVRMTTLNQNGKAVQVFVANLIVLGRDS